MDNTTFISLLLGALLPMVIEYAKRRNIPTSLIFFSIALVASLGYNAFISFVPPTVKESIFSFTSQIIATSVVLYELLLKGVFAQMTAANTPTTPGMPSDLMAFLNAMQGTNAQIPTQVVPQTSTPTSVEDPYPGFYVPPLTK